MKLEDYFNSYDIFNKQIVYLFEIHSGGIGDFFKFYLATLDYSIKNKSKFYLNDKTLVSKFVHQKYNLKFDECENPIIISDIDSLKNGNCISVKPKTWHKSANYVNQIIKKYKLEDLFCFSEDVVSKANEITKGKKYFAFHLRLGDFHLETDKKYVNYKNDRRVYDEKKINGFIEKYKGENVYFLCDNVSYRNKMLKKYNFLKSTELPVSHTALANTKEEGYLNSFIEFYILAHSEHIFACSEWSGFSNLASRFKNTKYTNINKLENNKIKMI